MKLPVTGYIFLFQEAPYLIHPFIETSDAFIQAPAKSPEFTRQKGPCQANLEPTVGKTVQHPNFTGNFERMVENR